LVEDEKASISVVGSKTTVSPSKTPTLAELSRMDYEPEEESSTFQDAVNQWRSRSLYLSIDPFNY
jgi:hypothetical protein